jgi:phosphoribosylformylglycinamidine synthase
MEEQLIAKVPADSLVLGGGAPVYTRNYSEPDYIQEIAAFDPKQIPVPSPTVEEMLPILEHLSAHPNLCSKEWVAKQYDDTIGTAHLGTRNPSDASLVWVKENGKALALTVDCNSRYVHADPYRGAAIAVAEAARNIVCSGARPLAVTNCLNFGNPYNPQVYWQFVKAIEGMGMACRALHTPVTDLTHQQTLDFKQAGDKIYLLGPVSEDLGSSQYLYSYHQVKLSPCPSLNMQAELALHEGLHALTRQQLVLSMHDISDGGVWISLLESALHRHLGFEVHSMEGIRQDAFWFGEGQSRALVSIDPSEQYAFEQCLDGLGLPYFALGTVTEGSIVLNGQKFPGIEHFASLYRNSLANKLNETS